MGCCLSLPRGANAPYPGAAQSEDASVTASARAINVPANNSTAQSQLNSSLPAALSPNRASQQHRTRRHRHRQPLDQHINKPLRLHEWSSQDDSWSRRDLDHERAAFFDTRVSGRQEIWQTLNAALEVLWASDILRADGADIQGHSDTDGDVDTDEHNPTVALATAQSILDAADITLPTGDLADGAYDPLGNYYQLPAHIVSDPPNITSGGSDNGALGESKADLTAAEDTAQDEDEDVLKQRREEKGKAVVNTRDQVTAIIRLSDTSKDLKLKVGKDETVRSITHRILQEIGRRPGCHVRLILMGKVLREGLPLMAQGWQPGNVINAFVYELSL